MYRVFNNYCTQLIDIPKLFIIQACKGSQLGVGVTVEKSGEKYHLIFLLSENLSYKRKFLTQLHLEEVILLLLGQPQHEESL